MRRNDFHETNLQEDQNLHLDLFSESCQNVSVACSRSLSLAVVLVVAVAAATAVRDFWIDVLGDYLGGIYCFNLQKKIDVGSIRIILLLNCDSRKMNTTASTASNNLAIIIYNFKITQSHNFESRYWNLRTDNKL